jgi:hypothetical protein
MNSKRWRRPLVVSLGVHVLLALLIYLGSSSDEASSPGWQPLPVDDREIDVPIMDIFEAVELARPAVVQLAANPPIPAPTPTVEPPAPLAGQAAEAGVPGLPAGPTTRPETGPDAKQQTGSPFFPVPAAARSVVYVIDRSGSMGEHGRLARARRELEASLSRLPESARFQVIVYNRQAEPLRIGGRADLVPATIENVSQASRLLRDLVPEGGTEHFAALRKALHLRPDVIFFLTDADDLNPADVRALTELNQGRTAIHVIEMTLANRDRPDMPMHQLAHGNRGGYRAVAAGP